MAVDFFLRIDGIEGESTDSKHKGEIDVMSWSWGASNTGMAGVGGGAGAGKATIQDLHFTTKLSKASPRLFLACASGQHLKQAKLSAVKAGAKQAEFLTITLNEVLVTSYQTGGSEAADIVPMDQVSLNFAKLRMEYRGQKADGSLDAPIVAGWDVKTNVKV
ncbi:MAG TPA: type VI secretion system tube protein Hcp [Solirubrobacteraceae bacterium]|nr:type VI secretion system tube protein Hcp [Solirubrobacteraceae bacterium]